MQWSRVCLVLLLLACTANTVSAAPKWIVVHTYPPHAELKDQHGDYLGQSGQRVKVDRNDYKNGDLEIHISLEGYLKAKYPYKISDTSSDRVPAQDVITLEPQSKWIGFRDILYYKPWIPALAVATLMTLAALALRGRRAERRMRKLEEYREEADGKDSLVSTTLGGHMLVKTLGRGGMATVYRGVPADTMDSGSAVAVKVLRTALLENQELADRFRREINVCRQMDHPSIVRLHNWGEEREYLYLILELMEGGTLRQALKVDSPSPQQLVAWLDAILSGLDYAHQRGIVHRDLKPDNIMLTAQGKAKILDFGLARAMDSEKITKTGSALGTPAYMAPEQIQSEELTLQSDQYTIGIVAYEMFTGQLPFDSADPMQLLFSHISDPPPPPRNLRPDLPEGFEQALLRMLAKDPSSRYPTIGQARNDLLRALKEDWSPFVKS